LEQTQPLGEAMPTYLAALLIGVLAGLRSLTPPAVVSWAARLGWLHLENTRLAFLGATVTPYILTVLALGGLIADQLPKTPSGKTAGPFFARIVTGALCGAAVGATDQKLFVGLVLGALGGVAGTLGGYEVRTRLARAIGRDLPIALLEDVVTI